MTSLGNHVTSYDTGSRPYVHDAKRGKWSSTWDFYFACIGHAFTTAHFSDLPYFIFMFSGSGVFLIIPYLCTIVVFSIPIFFIQAFLGQFSSSGFISAFRIAPLFKGVGYVILALNLLTLTYYSLYAAVPLLYLMSSFLPTLPWVSCGHYWNSVNCTIQYTLNETENRTDAERWEFETERYMYFAPTEYFHNIVKIMDDENSDGSHTMSWSVLGCTVLVWISVWYVLTLGTEKLGKLLRYSTITMLAILTLIFVRLMFLADGFGILLESFIPNEHFYHDPSTWFGTPILSLLSFGTGWGIVISLSSFNTFKTDIGKLSWMVCLSHFVIIYLSALSTIFAVRYVEYHLEAETSFGGYLSHPLEDTFVVFSLALGQLEMANIWSILFFLMLFIAELTSLVIQIFAVLSSLFDEYEKLRVIKKEITMGLVAILMLSSIYYCTNHGFMFFGQIGVYSVFTQMFLCLLMILVVCWVYGRLRFQRDVQFMLGKTFETWRVHMIRFATPFMCFFFMVYGIGNIAMHYYMYEEITILVGVVLKILPMVAIPIYIVIKLLQTTGTFSARFKRCVRPTDWYPADSADRQRYEETLGTPDISHQLVEMNFDMEDFGD